MNKKNATPKSSTKNIKTNFTTIKNIATRLAANLSLSLPLSMIIFIDALIIIAGVMS